MSSIRLKVQLGDETNDNHHQKIKSLLRFVYVLESPSNKTIDELIRTLQKYINQQFLNNNTQIVQLETFDGFILSKNDTCSSVLKDNDHIICIDMEKFALEISSTIDFDNLWLDLTQHDASDNEEKCIQIGLNHYSKLFVRMSGTTHVYGIYVFTVNELITIASEKRKSILQKRFYLSNMFSF
jgi:hypothetical protein